MTSSEKCRKEGNKKYLSVNDSLSPAIQQSRLHDAIKLYNKALSLAGNKTEETSAMKNLGAAHMKMARCRSLETKTVIYHSKESVHFLSAALSKTDGWHDSQISAEWVCYVQNRLMESVKTAVQLIKAMSRDDERLCELRQLCEYVHESQKSVCFFELGNIYLFRAIRAREGRDFKKSIATFADCHFPYQEAQRYLEKVYPQDDELESSIEDTLEQLNTNKTMAEAMQAIYVGDKLRDKVIFEDESICYDLLWESADLYRQAIIYSRDLDLESEAIASCRLGLLYIDVFKLTERGYQLLDNAFRLAEAMKPKSFRSEKWYKDCVKAMEAHQQARQKLEDEEEAKKREPYLEKLKGEIQELNTAASKGTEYLLRHVYLKHPPKNPNSTLEEPVNSQTLVARLKKALVHYHPDKNSTSACGMEWQVLCEEISKHISAKYQMMK